MNLLNNVSSSCFHETTHSWVLKRHLFRKVLPDHPVENSASFFYFLPPYLSLIHLITYHHMKLYISSVQFRCTVMSTFLWPHGLKHSRLPCPSPTFRACSNSCPSSHPTTSFSVVPFSSCHQCFLASGSFPMSQFFASGGQSIGASASASVLQMNIQDWYPLRLTVWISLQSKGLSKMLSNTTVQKHQFFGAQLSL